VAGELWWLLAPAAMAIVAVASERLPFKMAVPLSCAVILGALYFTGTAGRIDLLWVIAALVFSAAGDYYLSRKAAHEMFFLIGIGLYLFAHLGYLTAAWRNGHVNLAVLVPVLVVFLAYFFALLRPAITDAFISCAVLTYLLVSCLVLAVAAGLEWKTGPKALFVVGIALIMTSDTAISLSEFLRVPRVSVLILPSYYMAHLAITASLLRRG
jgi:hypothetical protein